MLVRPGVVVRATDFCGEIIVFLLLHSQLHHHAILVNFHLIDKLQFGVFDLQGLEFFDAVRIAYDEYIFHGEEIWRAN